MANKIGRMDHSRSLNVTKDFSYSKLVFTGRHFGRTLRKGLLGYFLRLLLILGDVQAQTYVVPQSLNWHKIRAYRIALVPCIHDYLYKIIFLHPKTKSYRVPGKVPP